MRYRCNAGTPASGRTASGTVQSTIRSPTSKAHPVSFPQVTIRQASVQKLKTLNYSDFFFTQAVATMASNPDASEIMMIGEVADYLKVTERTIYRLAAAKKIPAFKVGGSWRFSRVDIDCWIKQQSFPEKSDGRE